MFLPQRVQLSDKRSTVRPINIADLDNCSKQVSALLSNSVFECYQFAWLNVTAKHN